VRTKKEKIKQLYKILFKEYGPQGWWPIMKSLEKPAQNYHPQDYSFPHNQKELIEMALGAILTQNTSWHQVEKALWNLKKLTHFSLNKLLQLEEESFKNAIRPAGYFNQKFKKIIFFLTAFQKWKKKIPSRQELLEIWGLGPETADSILLYAYKRPIFVIDAYTQRILRELKLVSPNSSYDEAQELMMTSIAPNTNIYQEFHALLVAHAKRHYSKKPYAQNCELKNHL